MQVPLSLCGSKTLNLHTKSKHTCTLQQEECGCLGAAAWRSIRPSFLLVQHLSTLLFFSPSIGSFPSHLHHKPKHTLSQKQMIPAQCHHHLLALIPKNEYNEIQSAPLAEIGSLLQAYRKHGLRVLQCKRCVRVS